MANEPAIYANLTPAGKIVVKLFTALGVVVLCSIQWLTSIKGIIWGMVFGVVGVMIGALIGRLVALALGQRT